MGSPPLVDVALRMLKNVSVETKAILVLNVFEQRMTDVSHSGICAIYYALEYCCICVKMALAFRNVSNFNLNISPLVLNDV